jgi:glycosyltransferase involved in cell wall biosynthesis
MKILFTTEFYEPHKGGVEEVTRQVAERLVKKGHKVCVATSYIPERVAKQLNGVIIEDFKLGGSLGRGLKGSAAEIKRYQDFLCSGFDAVINNAAQIWTTDLAFEVVGSIKGKKLLIPCGYSGLNNPLYEGYFKVLPAHLAKYNKLIYMSPNYQDKIFGDEHGVGDKAVIIPNGAPAEEFLGPDDYNIREKLGIKTKFLAITVANHYRDKGHGFVIEAFKKMKRQDTTLLIVGENPGKDLWHKTKQFVRGCYKNCLATSLIHGNIKLAKGSSRELVLSAYKEADLFLFGSRVECAPLVLYESFASKTPFISTGVGNIPDYKDYVKIIKSPEEMVQEANRLLDNEGERQAMAEKAFNLWRESYTWDKIAEQYEKQLKD